MIEADFDDVLIPTKALVTLTNPCQSQVTADHHCSRRRLLGPRRFWHYEDEECDKWLQNYMDKQWTSQPLGSFRPHVCVDRDQPRMTLTEPPCPSKSDYTAGGCLEWLYFSWHLQSDDGRWAGEYGGPMFLMPGLVIARVLRCLRTAQRGRTPRDESGPS